MYVSSADSITVMSCIAVGLMHFWILGGSPLVQHALLCYQPSYRHDCELISVSGLAKVNDKPKSQEPYSNSLIPSGFVTRKLLRC